jgi:hypothetical protein
MDAVAHLELGVAQELAVVFAGHQAGQAPRLGIKGLLEPLVHGLGLGFLFRRKGLLDHGALS